MSIERHYASLRKVSFEAKVSFYRLQVGTKKCEQSSIVNK